jgi:hypothetical protein
MEVDPAKKMSFKRKKSNKENSGTLLNLHVQSITTAGTAPYFGVKSERSETPTSTVQKTIVTERDESPKNELDTSADVVIVSAQEQIKY